MNAATSANWPAAEASSESRTAQGSQGAEAGRSAGAGRSADGDQGAERPQGGREAAADGAVRPSERPRRSRTGRALLPLLVDLVVPVTAYYVLRGLGVTPLWALILAGLPTGAYLLWQMARNRRVDALGVFVLALLAVGTGVSFITGSPRFLLAKGGWFTAVIGLGFLLTLAFARPFAFTFARGALNRTHTGAAKFRTGDWDLVWDEQPRFRRVWRMVTAMWGAGLLVDAVLRVVIAYTLPVDAVPGLSGGLAAVTILLLQAGQQLCFRRTGLWRMLR